MMVTRGEMEFVLQVGRYPCEEYGRGVGANSDLCRTCLKWYHRRCSGLRSLSAAAVAHFECPASARGQARGAVGVDASVVVEVNQFCYLGDVLDCRAGAERAIRARVGVA